VHGYLVVRVRPHVRCYPVRAAPLAAVILSRVPAVAGGMGRSASGQAAGRGQSSWRPRCRWRRGRHKGDLAPGRWPGGLVIRLAVCRSPSSHADPAVPKMSVQVTGTPSLASTACTWSLQLVRRPTSLARYLVSSLSSRTGSGAIHASGRRPIRSRSARSPASRWSADRGLGSWRPPARCPGPDISQVPVRM
jgi:hypothetical protein